MDEVERRQFLKLGAVVPSGFLGSGGIAWERPEPKAGLEMGGRSTSPIDGDNRTPVPSTCWQCVTQCPIIGYLEEGRLVKIEGNPLASSTRGKLCARGQAGINQIYHPDRLLYPLKRAGKRGEGKWDRVSWDEALDLIVKGGELAGRSVKGLEALREEGTPEKFLFHYGRMVGSDWLILRAYFLAAYGTGSIGDHTSICNSAKATAYQLTRRGFAPSKDFQRTKMILNFGCSLLEAHTNHLPMAERWVEALRRGARLVTFDVRLSNTAARSTEWVPLRPATDLAVVLAMCNALLDEGLFDETAIEAYTNVTVRELQQHLAIYSPEWAEGKSGVPAQKIRSLAREFASSRPAFCISGRGAFMHRSGVETERALMMLEAMAGQIDLSGRRRQPRWSLTFPMPRSPAKRLNVFDGEEGAFAYPTAHVSHQILHMIDKGPERPEIYMVYCHNPVYSNGDCRHNERILRDVEKVPFLIAVDVALSETSALADLVLPDATYLERWSYIGRMSPEGDPEYSIRQPMHPPLGEARNFCDVACDIAKRLGLGLGFASAEDFVRAACEATPEVKEVGGFETMKKNGVWCATSVEDPQPSSRTTHFRIKSRALASKGFSAIPAWMPNPEHENLSTSELILTTYKVPTQSHSRTQNCKWLTELYHENPVWIHPKTAAALGIQDGSTITLTSEVGEIVSKARLTEGIHPKAVAISNHCGHWAYGEYASGVKSAVHVPESDGRLKWWKESGVHPNWLIPNRGDLIAGTLCWNDTVVRVAPLET